jgi:murein L,D-transpeptidase YafK
MAMQHRLVFLIVLFVWSTGAAFSQSSDEELPLYYVVGKQAIMYSAADSLRPYVQLKFREPLYLLRTDRHWSQVRTQDGALGYVHASAISNVWIRVSKRQQTVYVYRGTELIEKLPADLGHNSFADKERRGSIRSRDHWRTPEGVFFVVNKNPRSQFYKALVLNYPTSDDAARGLREGLISKNEHDAIIRAEATFSMPPMSTLLGGWIEIHGHGTGARSNWTQGCVAVRDEHMDFLWRWAQVGTPVLVEP